MIKGTKTINVVRETQQKLTQTLQPSKVNWKLNWNLEDNYYSNRTKVLYCLQI